MEFLNLTNLPAQWTVGLDREGRETLIIALKATFTIPAEGEDVALAEEQVPLVKADEFTGEPGKSAIRFETDFAHRKLYCDVLANASAHAPDGRPAERVPVGIRVGDFNKQFIVIGSRQWGASPLGVSASRPEPFVTMPISYDTAFGGEDTSRGDPTDVKSYRTNPVGRGYAHYKDSVDGKPLPNTEEIGRTVSDPAGQYRPMALGPVGRGWLPRAEFAGTYDKQWLDTRAPLWPADFDDRYFQAAPEDHWIPFPVGGEEVQLANLAPDGPVQFRLPAMPIPVLLVPYRGNAREAPTSIDTLLFEPDERRFSYTYRVTCPLARNAFELRQVVIGDTSRGWRRARISGKTYYRTLHDVVLASRGQE